MENYKEACHEKDQLKYIKGKEVDIGWGIIVLIYFLRLCHTLYFQYYTFQDRGGISLLHIQTLYFKLKESVDNFFDIF